MSDNDPQRVAVVTGASRGIGAAIARRLAADGRRVVLMSRSAEPLEALAAEIESAGGAATPRPVDVGDAGALAAAIESAASDLGRLDVLVNNAGVTRDNLALRMTEEEFDEVVRVNLKAAFIAAKAAARPMMKGRFGRIVSIGSTSGVVGNAGQANYCAAKAGLVGLTKALARELGGKGVTANVVAPGFIRTDMTASLPEDAARQFTEALAIRRPGEVEDIAAAVAYVQSDGAGYLTGQTICVDGGLTMC